jgi:hypothetical protein
VGIGNAEPSVAAVRGADGGSWYAIPPKVVPDRGQVRSDDLGRDESVVTSNKDSWNVLHEHVAGTYSANGVRHVGP